ncbi:MAG: HNH endonuclease [Deltaproteobacteria bacterium]|nr:MAG: HNH endonuclease [Deltaproteobacteria bacterium]
MEDWFNFAAVDDAVIKRERAKARELRKSRWWQRKTASGRCYYCGNIFTYQQLTMDHLIPLARGGRSTRDNLVPACKECNNHKKNLLPVEWEEYLGKIGRQV